MIMNKIMINFGQKEFHFLKNAPILDFVKLINEIINSEKKSV